MKADSLIISAGFSSRMVEFKPLMPYGDLNFLTSILVKLAAVSGKIIIVTGYRAGEITASLDDFYSILSKDIRIPELPGQNELKKKIEIVHNPDFEKGMFTSLKSGLKQLKSSNWIFYHFVDQPQIPASFYADFIRQIDGKSDVIIPSYRMKSGHPILFNQRIIGRILNSDDFSNLKIVLNSPGLKKKYWDCPYPQILKDFDRKSDIE